MNTRLFHCVEVDAADIRSSLFLTKGLFSYIIKPTQIVFLGHYIPT